MCHYTDMEMEEALAVFDLITFYCWVSWGDIVNTF